MSQADPIAAVVAYLKADPDVSTRVGEHVYGGSIPRALNASMPTEAVVVRPAGGYSVYGRGTLPLGDPRMDTDCYGTSEYDSWLVHLDVQHAMKILLRHRAAGVLLHSAAQSAGGVTARDPQTPEWPLTIASYTVISSELTAA